MAIDTPNRKLAIMEWDDVFEPAIPLSPGPVFNQGHKQQLIWGYPGVIVVGLTGLVRPKFKALFRRFLKGMQ